MLLMAIAGYMVVKAKVFDPAGIRPLSNMVAYVLTPCLIISAFTIDMTPERIHNFWFCVLFPALSMRSGFWRPGCFESRFIWMLLMRPL